MRHITINFLVAPIFFLLFFAKSLASPLIVDELPQRPIYMFFDESEYQREDAFGAMSYTLFAAMYQQAGPILTSSSLLTNIFFEQGAFLGIPRMGNKNLSDQSEKHPPGDPEGKKIRRKIMLKILQFNDNDWVIKRVNDSLSLLLPVTYLKQLKIDSNAAKKSNSVAVTDLELHLGLKIEHMETIKLKDITYAQQTSANYVPRAFYNKKSKKSDVFCLYSDYAKTKISAPMWSICIHGHGQIEESIVGMDISYFQRVLNFLNRFIKTRVLLYRSCFASGINNELIFKDTQAALERIYNFPIISQTIIDAVGLFIFFIEYDEDQNRFEFLTNINFNSFAKISSQAVIKYSELARQVFDTPFSEKKSKEFWGNLPQIKFPGVEWFSVLDSSKYIASIGNILARARGENRPLKLSTYFGSKDLKALLLYAHEVPFELIIDEPDFEAIISMLPGHGIHKLKKISSTEPLDKIIAWFFQVDRRGTEKKQAPMSKQFYIEQINKDVVDVVLYLSFNKKIVFYTQLNKIFMQVDDDLSPRLITQDDDDFALYLFMLKTLKAYSPQGRYDFTTKDEILFLPIKRNTFFKRIHASKQSDITMEDIVTELVKQMDKGTVLWIDSLKAVNNNDLFKLPAQKTGEIVTLTDVIIDAQVSKKYFDYYYTHENSFFKKQTPIKDYKPLFSWLTNMQLGYSKLTVRDIQQFQEKLTQSKLVFKKQSKTKKPSQPTAASKPSGLKPEQKKQAKHGLVSVEDIIITYEELKVALKTLAEALGA